MTYEDETINQTNDDAKQKKKHSDSFASVTSLKNDIDTLRPFVSDNPKAVELILLLIERMDGTNKHSCLKKDTQRSALVTRKNNQQIHCHLKEKQIITTSRSGGSVVIHVNSKVSWKKGRGKFNFAKLNATVLLSESEQDQAESTK